MRTKEFEPDDVAEAAMRVFWELGYSTTPVQHLVEGTGLSFYEAPVQGGRQPGDQPQLIVLAGCPKHRAPEAA